MNYNAVVGGVDKLIWIDDEMRLSIYFGNDHVVPR